MTSYISYDGFVVMVMVVVIDYGCDDHGCDGHVEYVRLNT
jgi:hypothetical protein